ncbi:head-tail adaptor protein [Sphingomicrobium arenosum]|uniref:head-tail adaptor protein n=1 Tax=Sphingomicrobium arenosum TaxID=2233861 RepID=UPI00223EBC4B|nr:head-tail adaptor protein [Sphingomicrobium arenosum]
MNAREFAGQLRERVTIEAPLAERSPTGVRTGEWVEVARCLASIRLQGNGPEAEGMALSAMARFVVTIRWREGLAVGQQVRWRGGRMIIRQLRDDPRQPDRLELYCEELRQ